MVCMHVRVNATYQTNVIVPFDWLHYTSLIVISLFPCGIFVPVMISAAIVTV